MDRENFDREFLDRLIRRDPEAVRRFLHYFSPLLHAKFMSVFHVRELVDDLKQETFCRFFASAPQIREPEKLAPYILNLANHLVQEQFRRNAKDGHSPGEPPDLLDLVPSQEIQVLSAERARIIRDTLKTLAPKDRRVIEKIFLNEEDKDQVCRELGITRDYLRTLIHRAKLRFRNNLDKS